MIDSIMLWHRRARPNPTYEDLQVQLGCHLEEVCEQLDELQITDMNHKLLVSQATDLLEKVSILLKQKELTFRLYNRENFLKELCDSVVTAAGVAHCADMAFVSAVEEVNASNWSKFNYKGFPEFDKNGKIKKGESYKPANMEGMA